MGSNGYDRIHCRNRDIVKIIFQRMQIDWEVTESEQRKLPGYWSGGSRWCGIGAWWALVVIFGKVASRQIVAVNCLQSFRSPTSYCKTMKSFLSHIVIFYCLLKAVLWIIKWIEMCSLFQLLWNSPKKLMLPLPLHRRNLCCILFHISQCWCRWRGSHILLRFLQIKVS